jgi:hypothetical protein
VADEELLENARSKISPIVTREFPDSILLVSDGERMSKYPPLGRVRLSCYQGRVHALLPMFPPKDSHGESGVVTDAGPCQCGGDRATCRFIEVRSKEPFDLGKAVRQAADMVKKADSLPHVARHLKCPKGCQENPQS